MTKKELIDFYNRYGYEAFITFVEYMYCAQLSQKFFNDFHKNTQTVEKHIKEMKKVE